MCFSQAHQSKQALELCAVIRPRKVLAGSQNKSSGWGLPGSQLTKIYYQRMQPSKLCGCHSSRPQAWASVQELPSHIWWSCDNQCLTILEMRYSGYQEVDLPFTSLTKHTLIFKRCLYKAAFCLGLGAKVLCWDSSLGCSQPYTVCASNIPLDFLRSKPIEPCWLIIVIWQIYMCIKSWFFYFFNYLDSNAREKKPTK